MNILLFGGSGQVGWELQRSLAPLGRVSAPTHAACDLTDPDAIRRCIETAAPQVVVNAAAYTAVDRAEAEAELAERLNALAPAVMAETAARLGAVLVHYSTDYVYRGDGERPWREDDAPAPLSVYGQTKLAGDRAIQRAGGVHLILRTSWVYGVHGRNFPRTILELARQRQGLTVVADQIGAPTGADLIADVTAHALRAVRDDPSRGGLYHLAAAGEASWYGVARQVLELAARRGAALQTTADQVRPIASTDYPTAARRPANSRLDTARLRETFGLYLPPWHEGLARFIETLT